MQSCRTSWIATMSRYAYSWPHLWILPLFIWNLDQFLRLLLSLHCVRHSHSQIEPSRLLWDFGSLPTNRWIYLRLGLVQFLLRCSLEQGKSSSNKNCCRYKFDTSQLSLKPCIYLKLQNSQESNLCSGLNCHMTNYQGVTSQWPNYPLQCLGM